MAEVEVQLPEDVYAQFQRIAEQEFVNEEEAVEELISMGLSAYNTDVSEDENEFEEEMWNDQTNPMEEEDRGRGNRGNDEYTL